MLRSVSQQCATCPWRRQGVITGSEQESFTLCLWENIFGKATHNSHISAEFTDQKGQEADGNQMQQLSPPLRDIDDPDFVVLLPQREQSCLGRCRWWPSESSAWCVKFKEPYPEAALWACERLAAVCCAAEPRNWPEAASKGNAWSLPGQEQMGGEPRNKCPTVHRL